MPAARCGIGGGGGGGAGLGGAVLDDGTFTANGCTFSNNQATGGAGGSTPVHNAGEGGGGGIGGPGGNGNASFHLIHERSGTVVSYNAPGGLGGDAAGTYYGGFGGGFGGGGAGGGFAGGTGGPDPEASAAGAAAAAVPTTPTPPAPRGPWRLRRRRRWAGAAHTSQQLQHNSGGAGGGGGAGLGGALFSNGGTLTLDDDSFVQDSARGVPEAAPPAELRRAPAAPARESGQVFSPPTAT